MARTRGSWRRWRVIGWTTGAVLLLLPLLAMQFTDEVSWNAGDFAVAGVLLISTGVSYELAARKSGQAAYRAAVAVALAAAFLLIWINGAVGLIGSEANDINAAFGGVLAVGVVGAVIARLEPRGMARALLAAAFAQTLVAGAVLIAGMAPADSGPLEIVAVNGFFVALFLGSAVLFRRAAQHPTCP